MSLKYRIVFYFLLFLLILSRLMLLFNIKSIIDTWEIPNLFIAATVIKYHMFSPAFFHVASPYAGGGDYVYSILSVPFVWLFGRNYFSIRILAIVLNSIELLLIYYIFIKYFNFYSAIVVSLLFIFPSEFISHYAAVGMGRHFHLNLFFLLSLLSFIRFKEKKSFKWAAFFGLSIGSGIYFYPAFVVTLPVFLIFFLAEFEWKKLSDYGKLISALCIITVVAIAYKEVLFKLGIHRLLLTPIELLSSQKNIMHFDSLLVMFKRYILFLSFLLPDFLSFNFLRSTNVLEIFDTLKEINILSAFQNLINLTHNSIYSLFKVALTDIYRLFLLVSLFFFTLYSFPKLKVLLINLIPFRKKKKYKITDVIISFLVLHFCIYTLLYNVNGTSINTYKYYLPLFVNIIMILAICICYRKTLIVALTMLAIMPGLIFQHEIVNENQARYSKILEPVYYTDIAALEFTVNKNNTIRKKISAFYPVVLHTMGYWQGDADSPPSRVKELAANVCQNEKGVRYLFEGWISQIAVNCRLDMNKIINNVNELNEKEKGYAYSGIGEALIRLCEGENTDVYTKMNLLKIKDMISARWKPCFYEGMGRGLIRLYASGAYGTRGPLVSDKRLFRFYLQRVEKSYIDNFIQGFNTEDYWNPL